MKTCAERFVIQSKNVRWMQLRLEKYSSHCSTQGKLVISNATMNLVELHVNSMSLQSKSHSSSSDRALIQTQNKQRHKSPPKFLLRQNRQRDICHFIQHNFKRFPFRICLPGSDFIHIHNAWMRSILLGEFQRMFSFRIDDMPWRRLSWIDDMPCKSGVSVDVMPCASGFCREASLLHCFFFFFFFDSAVSSSFFSISTTSFKEKASSRKRLSLNKASCLSIAWSCRKALILWSFLFFAILAKTETSTSEGFNDPVFKCWITAWHPKLWPGEYAHETKISLPEWVEASATRLNWVIILKTFWTRYMYNPVNFLIQYSALDSEAPASSGLLSSSFFFKSKACRRDIPELLADSIKAQIVSGSTSTRTGPSLFDFRRTAGKFRAIVNLKSVCTFNGM